MGKEETGYKTPKDWEESRTQGRPGERANTRRACFYPDRGKKGQQSQIVPFFKN